MLFFLILSSICLIIWFIWDHVRYSKYPPGPLRLPIFGNIFQLARISELPGVAFQGLSKKYGEVIFVKMGAASTVVANTLETVKYLRSHELCQNRAQHMAPGVWERMFRKNLGIVFANGPEQQTIRRFTIRTLRDFGFGKGASLDKAIQEELEKFLEHLNDLCKQNPKGIEEANGLFDLTVTNIVWRMVTGVKFDLKDEKMLKLLKLSHDVIQCLNLGMSLQIAFPSLFHMFPDTMGRTELRKNTDCVADYIKETIQHHRSQGSYKTNPQCFLDIFLNKIDEEQRNGEARDPAFRDEQLVMTLLDLFQAASDTTSNSLSFCMLYMTLYPEIQAKVQKEMDHTLSKEETTIALSMKDRLPYTYATLLECSRHCSIVPTPGAHVAAESFYYKGYLIEKGVYVLPNIYAVHFSEETWGDPQNFRPERFLTEEGHLDINIASNVVPFGFGSRICLGISMAENTLFTYFASVLKNFSLEKVSEGDVLSTVPNIGITQSPKPYRVKYIPRKMDNI